MIIEYYRCICRYTVLYSIIHVEYRRILCQLVLSQCSSWRWSTWTRLTTKFRVQERSPVGPIQVQLYHVTTCYNHWYNHHYNRYNYHYNRYNYHSEYIQFPPRPTVDSDFLTKLRSPRTILWQLPSTILWLGVHQTRYTTPPCRW